ncbi:cupin domain-containing protein [Nitratireductor pacificus]|uniref:Cupin 2 domain-containing protein n=1 Tax=Nitratireductor pacificus pht-3B TaxID=391937 RepID=K2LMF5_9HYPH|nr:cupin domain-containing protein [Nitratireductor pacificus]EKF18974.1 cupin 2 domain-containing protein [Nitratireductor pacificus pht-3B]
MYQVLRRSEQKPSVNRTIAFEGEPYGSDVSLFLMDSPPGHGPVLHRHPYSETWVVRSGEAEFTVDGETTRAGPGDIVVVGAQIPHRFVNVGEGRLDMVCIHASERFIQEDL